MPVTSYNLPIDSANSPRMWGRVADLGDATIASYVSTETTQPFTNAANTTPGLMLFGFGVVRSPWATGNDTIMYPSAITDQFEGILLASDAIECRLGYSVDPAGRCGYPPAASGLPGSASASSIAPSVIRRADRICVPVEVTGANRGDTVFMRVVNGTGVARGVFRNNAVPGETIQIARARFLSFVSPPSPGQLATGYISLEGVI